MVDLTKLGQATVMNRNNNKPDALHMITPINIVSDMVDLIDSSSWTKDTKFLDIACKSGNFLREIYVRLMNCSNLIKEFPDKVYRSEWILNNQLYGIAFSELDVAIATRNVYGIYTSMSNIKYMPNYMDLAKRNRVIERVKETFGTMKFDVIVGNPPYNNDIYIDFVLMSKQLTCGQGNICMITPAKWQAKGGEKNEQFRREIVPYMKDIVYYPEPADIFDIHLVSGISYYLITDCKHTDKRIVNACNNIKHLNSSTKRKYNHMDTLFNAAYSILNKVYSSGKFYESSQVGGGQYKVVLSHLVNTPGGTTFTQEHNLLVLCPMSIEKQIEQNNTFTLFRSNDIDKCKNYISYVDTKFVRFLIFSGLCSGSIKNSETWRFVPDPENFDHIFTDEELYKKYNLTQEEINIIESIIKERK